MSETIILSSPLTLYIVRNREGRYFRSVGYGGGGLRAQWVEKIEQARVYQKLGQARSRVTFFAKHYPEYGVPDLLQITADTAVVVDDTVRVAKALQKAQDTKLKRQQRELEAKRNALDEQIARLTQQRERI